MERSAKFAGVFEECEVRIARCAVRRFLIISNLNVKEDFEEMLHDCLMHWLKRKAHYSPGMGANIKTFMRKVMDMKLWDIGRECRADKRSIRQHVISFSESVASANGNLSLIDVLEYKIPEKNRRNPDIQMDLENTLGKLNTFQRQVCEMLKNEYSIQEISRMVKKPRSSLYDEIKHIRKIFLDAGLKAYLESPDIF